MSRYYPEDLIDSMVAKMTSPPTRSATSLAKEVGIPKSTLSRWVRSRATVEGRVLATRSQTYTEAKRRNPSRGSRSIRNWEPVREASLNPASRKAKRAFEEQERIA